MGSWTRPWGMGTQEFTLASSHPKANGDGTRVQLERAWNPAAFERAGVTSETLQTFLSPGNLRPGAPHCALGWSQYLVARAAQGKSRRACPIDPTTLCPEGHEFQSPTVLRAAGWDPSPEGRGRGRTVPSGDCHRCTSGGVTPLPLVGTERPWAVQGDGDSASPHAWLALGQIITSRAQT